MTLRTSLFAAAALAVSALGAQAATVSFSQTQSFTQSGQNLTFDFTGLAASDGTGGTLTFATDTARADGLDLTFRTEFFALDVDGTSFGNFSCVDGTGLTNLGGTRFDAFDCTFDYDLTLGGSDLDGFLADGALTAAFDFSSAVDVYGANDALTVTLSYDVAPVPLPASSLMLLGALGGLAAWRRRRG